MSRFHRSVPVAASVLGLILLSTFSVARPFSAGQEKEKPSLQKTRPETPPSQDQKDDQTIKIGTDLVVLDVAVVDQNNRPVMNLKQEQFQVLEDKVPQKVEFFTPEQVPVSLVFTIDTSGSMRAKLNTVISAASNLVKESKQSDEIAIIEFKDQPELLEEFTTDINDVIDTLGGLVATGQTAMLDALYLAANYAHKEGKNRRKAVVMVTDGDERNSYYKVSEVVDALHELDVRVYLIGFTFDMDSGTRIFNKSPKEKAENLLNKLASETGGRAFFPKELSEVHDIAAQISADLRTQYSIGYYPTNTRRDGTFRTIKVEVDSAGGRKLVARTRAGYVAPSDAAPPKSNK
jgi:Ca-activated chloride channel family protein